MANQGALVLLLALAWSAVSAFPSLSYPEDLRDSRIVSGWEASEGQFPYQLSIRIVNEAGGVTACGATVIHSEWALTAAHCTARRVTIVIRAGVVNLTRPLFLFETSEYYNHPDYIEELTVVQPNDIGVIKYNRVLEFNDLVKPIRLQSSLDKNKDYRGIRLHASGWGRTWTLGPSPENLNWVFLTGTSNLQCWLAYGGSPIVVDSTICAAYYNVTSQSTCQGDSGGPLVVYDYDGQETQVGISSFVSSTGCHTDFPAGFIRPGHYHEWLLEVTGINFDWEPQESTPAPDESEENGEDQDGENEDEDNGDEDNGDEDNGDEDNGDEDNGDEDNGDEDNGDEDNGDEDNGDEDNGDEDNGDEDNGDEDNGDEDNGDEDNGDEDNGDEDNGDEDNGDEDSGDEDNGDEDNGDEDSGDEDNGDEDSGDEDNGESEEDSDSNGDSDSGSDSSSSSNSSSEEAE